MSQARRSRDGDEDLVIDSLRLTDDQWYDLLDLLDRQAVEQPKQHSGRRHERVSYRNLVQLLILVKYQDGRRQRFSVRTRDLSTSGLGFLHGNYMHPGTQVELMLHHQQLGKVKHLAVVRRCRHITGTIHEVGIEFGTPLDDLQNYLLVSPQSDRH